MRQNSLAWVLALGMSFLTTLANEERVIIPPDENARERIKGFWHVKREIYEGFKFADISCSLRLLSFRVPPNQLPRYTYRSSK
jgi:hypothetical protein